jgi:SAM-dependent methyltransferase
MSDRATMAQLGGHRWSRRVRDVLFGASRFGERRGWDWLTYHPGLYLFFHYMAAKNARPFIASIRETFPSAAMLADVGCGTGAYAAAGRSAGLVVVGYERSRVGRAIAHAQRVRAKPFDLTDQATLDAIGSFDLAYSLEVAEHLPPELGERLVALLLTTAPTVVFTAAHPGQGGQGHVNEQAAGYWIERFAAHGGTHMPDVTAALRDRFEQAGMESYLIENVLVFRRADQAPQG